MGQYEGSGEWSEGSGERRVGSAIVEWRCRYEVAFVNYRPLSDGDSVIWDEDDE